MSAGRVRVCHGEKMPLRWIVLGLLMVGTVTLPAGPAAAQAVPPDPCDALTAPGGDPCQPIPATQPGLLQSLLTPDRCADWAAQAPATISVAATAARRSKRFMDSPS